MSAGKDSEAKQDIRQDSGQYGVFRQRPWRGSFDSMIRALSPSWPEGVQTTEERQREQRPWGGQGSVCWREERLKPFL